MSRKCLWVFVNFHLWPQFNDNCKYVELGIWTPKRVMKLNHTRLPLCVCTAFVQRSRSVLNAHGEEPAASYRWTGWSSRPQEIYRYQHIHKEEQGRNLERNIQRCGMQVIRRFQKQTTTTTTKLPWAEEPAGSVCVCLWTSTFALKLQTTAIMWNWALGLRNA